MSGTVLAAVVVCGLAALLHEPLDDEEDLTARAVTAGVAAELCALLPTAQFGERVISLGRAAGAPMFAIAGADTLPATRSSRRNGQRITRGGAP